MCCTRFKRLSSRLLFVVLLGNVLDGHGLAEDWPQFRGANGDARSVGDKTALKWSDTENLAWKTELPGAGSSSPIIINERIFVTCYSGYGLQKSSSNDISLLKRHLVSLNRADGSVLWTKTIENSATEDGYQGYLTEHGYASSTPVSDGERVYCFFGKSGVIAFDFNGEQLWRTNVGQESSNRKWGSAASLVLWKDFVIVNASEESQSIRAIDKKSGREVWKAAGSALELAYGTPAIFKTGSDQTDVVIAVPGEVWGLNAETGKLRWFAEHTLTGNVCPSVVIDEGNALIFGGFRTAGSLSLKIGGTGDITKSSINWTSRNSSYVATPLLYEGRLYWIDDRGQAFCTSSKTGELIYRERVSEITSGGRPVYASPILSGNRIYVATRWDGVLVLAATPHFQVLAQNKFQSDESDFHATPSVSDNQIFLRSNRFIYCVSDIESKTSNGN